MSSFDLGALVAACRDLAERAGKLVSTIYEKGDFGVIEKTYGDNRKLTSLRDILNAQEPTTMADELAQKLIIGSLQKTFPKLRVLGEEENVQYNEEETVEPNTKFDLKIPDKYKNIDVKDLVVWVDPVDGTKEFTEGIKSAVTTLIGIAWKGRPIAGVVARPFTGEVIWGVVGLGAYGFNNEEQLKQRRSAAKKSRVVCCTRSHFSPSMRAYIAACKPTGFVRAGGSGGKVLMCIEGEADAYVQPSLGTKKWDTCAPEAVLLALGGRLTKPDGTLYDYDPARAKPMNSEGFIATVFDEEYHETYLENNLKIFQLDLILFGATGYTGKLAVEYIVDQYIYKMKHVQEQKSDADDEKKEMEREKKLQFGIAGRSKVKLENVLYEIKHKGKYEDIKDDIDSRISIIECDCFDVDSVEAMIQKTSVVVSTVGPYAKYGENIITACCKYGVDYVDLTGEFGWVKRMILKHGQDAKRSHARIINFGGCVAALTDCAIYAGVEQLKSEDENAVVESIKPGIKPSSKGTSSGGTVASWLNSIESGAYKYDMHDAFFLCEKSEDYAWQSQHKQPKYPIIQCEYNDDMKMYAIPFIYGPVERMVFMRSNELLGFYYGEDAKIYENVMFIKNFVVGCLISFFSWLIPMLLSFALCRSCLVKLVKTMAYKQGQGPSLKQLQAQKWRELIYVNGKNKEQKQLTCTVDIRIFGDYGYLNTAKLLIEQGIICSLQRSNPKIRKIKGGFLTPAAAFKSGLPKRLNARLKEFEIVYKIIK